MPLGSRYRRGIVGLCMAAVLSIAIALPALATQTESGTISCSSPQKHSFLRERFNDWIGARAPGLSSYYYFGWYDGLWHVWDGQGLDFGGSWRAQANPSLDYAGTYAYCSQFE